MTMAEISGTRIALDLPQIFPENKIQKKNNKKFLP
jgi:hypothetical protein